METKPSNTIEDADTGTGITPEAIPLHIYGSLLDNGWTVARGIHVGADLTPQELDSHLTALFNSSEYNKARGSYRRIHELIARHFFNLGRRSAEGGMTERARDIYNMALIFFGRDAQRRMAIEEASELIEALVREDRGRTEKKGVITEIADTLIMCEQLSLIYGEEEVKAEKAAKLERLVERLEKYRR